MNLIKLDIEIHEKGWGREIWYVNNDKYCFKRLEFREGGRSSLHFHQLKTETWIVEFGIFEIIWLDLKNGQEWMTTFVANDVIHVPNYTPHRITAKTQGTILEISTPHKDSDSYRVSPGDSQNENKIS